MRWKFLFSAALAIALLPGASGVAQDQPDYMPSLGDIMAAIQLRHAKLWYAGKLGNWPLAEYERAQLDTSFEQMKRLFPSLPPSDLTGANQLMADVGESIKASDDARFEDAFSRLTADCNGCHERAERDFIHIRVPTLPSPYSNQVFGPRQ